MYVGCPPGKELFGITTKHLVNISWNLLKTSQGVILSGKKKYDGLNRLLTSVVFVENMGILYDAPAELVTYPEGYSSML